MKKLLICFISVICLVSCKKEPVDNALINEDSYVFQNDNRKLFVPVKEAVSWREPLKSNDCALGTVSNSRNWQITNNTDYIEVSIQLPDGVLPGIDNSRSFTLYNVLSNGQTTIRPLPLTMESAPSNTYKVYTATWRFSLNANENLANEIIQTGSYNDKPFERKIANTTLGSEWVIIVPQIIRTDNVFASIRYYLHMGNVKICSK